MISVREALNIGRDTLKNNGVESFSLDAELLLIKTTGLTKTDLFIKSGEFISDKQYNIYLSMLKERVEGCPAAYITGSKGFMDFEFSVNPCVLIPRPDTEILVEKAIELIKKNSLRNILDIGTGSGCIAISIAKYCPDTIVTAADISSGALETAKTNAAGIGADIRFIQSDLFSELDTEDYGHSLDMIISNPPYISDGEMKELDDGITDYEPRLALYGGAGGLDFYRRISTESPAYLKPGGILIFEIGCCQRTAVTEIMMNSGFTDIDFINDLSGRNRVIWGISAKRSNT